ncbi:hypothetical protein L484_016464 [Morus notabilis]|uniref:Uncharacterized protein n=1 Tax=Morus notabilis TaxID=981085 RepID=W9QXI7_9ROSA|nr:hypothetical protein L484_016464 [Morus notabilis]
MLHIVKFGCRLCGMTDAIALEVAAAIVLQVAVALPQVAAATTIPQVAATTTISFSGNRLYRQTNFSIGFVSCRS